VRSRKWQLVVGVGSHMSVELNSEVLNGRVY